MMQLNGPDKRMFLPNTTTSGHYQIELQCPACHGEAFAGAEEIQKNCVRCHGEELKEAKDSHPKSKFTDPRNASILKKLDARFCAACHVEHQPEITRAMGVTQPDGFCIKCHEDIADDRPSHAGMAFTTCASAGCHNFHDNKGLYEDFLLKHAGEPFLFRPEAIAIPDRQASAAGKSPNAEPLTAARQDAPADFSNDARIVHDWAGTRHAEAGVNCSGCHQDAKRQWVGKPGHQVCATCHSAAVKTYLEGKHGMRLNADLPPMRPDMARLPMRKQGSERELGCSSCHRPHEDDRAFAEVAACESCHADPHSGNYRKSAHFRAWLRDSADSKAAKIGVSCATCHLPAFEQGDGAILTQHNQNLNLRPNEKMLRSVCLNCHGLEFSIDALADPELVRNNFSGRPGKHVPGIDMALSRKNKSPTPRIGENP